MVLLNLIKYLDRKSISPVILTLSPEPSNSALPEFKQMGIEIHTLGISRMQGILRGASDLVSFVSSCRPDIVQSQGIRADVLSARRLGNFRRVAVMHNYPCHDYPMKFGNLLGHFMAWYHFRSWQEIDFTVACSASVSRLALKHGLLSPRVILNGVDTRIYFPASESERLILRQKLGLPSDRRVFVFVGSLIARKNPKTVIYGFLGSRASKKSILLILGDGPLRRSCETAVENNPHVRFLGYVDNVMDYLRASDYFISASLSEGLPNTVLEALACGLPICVSDIEQHREILSLASGAGVMFAADAPRLLAKRLDELLEADKVSMSREAVGIVERHLNADRMARSYQRFYYEILGR